MMLESKNPRPIIGRLNVYGILALAGITGPVILLITDWTAAFTQPGYDMIQHTISSLAWTSLGWVQSLGFLVIGLLVEVFSVGLLFGVRGRRGFLPGIALLVIFGFGMLLLGAFKEDPAGTQATIQGTIHMVTAFIVFISFPIASLLITFSLRKDPQWKKIFLYTVIVNSLAVVFLVAHFILAGYGNGLGLDERLMVANILIWVEIMAIRLLRISLRTPEILSRPTIF
jgi:hypothetical protein